MSFDLNLRKNSFWLSCLIIVFLSTLSVPVTSKEKRISMENADRLVKIMERQWKQTEDYTVITYKQERHGGELVDREKIFTKFKKPFSIYMRWVKDNPPEHKNPNLGQEMIFEKGWNNNKIYSHMGKRSFLPDAITSLAGLYYDYKALDPQSRAATYYQRHTVDEVPFGATIDRIARAVRSGIKHPDDGVYFIDKGLRNVMGEASGCIEGVLPDDKREAYYEHRVEICMGLDSHMPTQARVWNDNGKLLENYRMKDITINPGLSRKEFRPSYPKYNFE